MPNDAPFGPADALFLPFHTPDPPLEPSLLRAPIIVQHAYLLGMLQGGHIIQVEDNDDGWKSGRKRLQVVGEDATGHFHNPSSPRLEASVPTYLTAPWCLP